jgi:hypothetical protein
MVFDISVGKWFAVITSKSIVDLVLLAETGTGSFCGSERDVASAVAGVVGLVAIGLCQHVTAPIMTTINQEVVELGGNCTKPKISSRNCWRRGNGTTVENHFWEIELALLRSSGVFFPPGENS